MLGEGLFHSLHMIKLLPHHVNVHHGLSEPSELTDLQWFPPQQMCPHANRSSQIQPKSLALSPSVWLSLRGNSLSCTKAREIKKSQPSPGCFPKTIVFNSLDWVIVTSPDPLKGAKAFGSGPAAIQSMFQGMGWFQSTAKAPVPWDILANPKGEWRWGEASPISQSLIERPRVGEGQKSQWASQIQSHTCLMHLLVKHFHQVLKARVATQRQTQIP